MGEIPESKVAKFTPEPSSWLSLRLFYLRVRKCEVKDSMLDSLTITHIPLTPDTVLQVNGSIQSSINNGHVSCSLRRDRVDRKSEEATFVSTETVRMTGSVRFEVQNKDEKLLVGILEMCDVDGSNGEAIKKGRSWVMKCQVAMQRGSGFLKGGEVKSPTIEVYVAGLSQGAPIVFTKAMHLHFRRKRQVKVLMEPIPECGEQVEDMKEMPQKHDPEDSEYRCYKPEPSIDDIDYNSLYMTSAGLEGEDSELSWFTAGVSVGVGISLCIGIGACLLARSYQSTSRSLKRRLISNLF